MTQVVVKLFRDPEDAERATNELKSQGYKDDDVQVIASAKDSDKQLSELTEKWGIPEDTVAYYKLGTSTGAAVVRVQTDEARAPKVREILRSSDTEPTKCQMEETSPGFVKAERMAQTNPIDAKMTGDFRRY